MRLFNNSCLYSLGLALACTGISSCAPSNHGETSIPEATTDKGTVPVKQLYLNSQAFSFAATPNLGGRALHFSVPGKPNLLLIDNAVATRPSPTPTADGQHIDYHGHIVWLGPQSQWWTHQILNPKRRDDGARWPPDPWLVWNENETLTSSPTEIALQGASSPLSGISLNKTFTVIDDGSKLLLTAQARNNNDHSVDNNLWFNTRVTTDAVIYTPAPAHNSVRFNTPQSPHQPPAFLKLNNVLKISRAIALGEDSEELHLDSADILDAEKSKGRLKSRREKLFIQANEGWIAAFIKGQLLLIEFEPIEASRIHPEHTLIEIYYAFGSSDSSEIIELEVHGPLSHYATGESIGFYETWQALAYTGIDSDAARLSFLEAALKASNSTR